MDCGEMGFQEPGKSTQGPCLRMRERPRSTPVSCLSAGSGLDTGGGRGGPGHVCSVKEGKSQRSSLPWISQHSPC